jgi:hypothetical protein
MAKARKKIVHHSSLASTTTFIIIFTKLRTENFKKSSGRKMGVTNGK